MARVMARTISGIGLAACVLAIACGDIDRRPRQPNERPVADLELPNRVSVGQIAVFDASGSYDPDGEVESYRFSPGETGEELITAEPLLEYIYSRSGDFVVTLTVVDNRGGEDSTAATLTVQP